MSENIKGKIENYKESVKRYIFEDLQRNKNERNEAEQERINLEGSIDVNDRDENVLYQRNLQRLKNADTAITNTKRAAKYSIEQLIALLKERNQELATNYMSKKPGQIQLEINRLETENQRLEFEITHKLQVIEQTQQVISKYAEIGDLDRKIELESKVSNLRTEITEIRNQQKSNSDKIETCKNYEEEYKENMGCIKALRDIAKQNEIELEEKQKDVETPEKPTPEAGEKPAPEAGAKPAPEAGEKPAPEAGEKPSPVPTIKIYANKSGTKIDIQRDGKLIPSSYTPLRKSKSPTLEEIKGINPEVIELANKVGDKFIVNEILCNKDLGDKEKEQYLKFYADMLNTRKLEEDEKSKRPKIKKKDREYITYMKNFRKEMGIFYDLRGLDKMPSLSEDDRQYLLEKAKEAEKLGIGKVKAGFKIRAQWAWEGVVNTLKEIGNRGGNRFQTRKEPEQLSAAPEIEDSTNTPRPGELTPQQKAEVQAATQALAAKNNTTATVDQDMSAQIENEANKSEGIEPAED